MTDERDVEETLYGFAAEPVHDGDTLRRYLEAHPHLADELVDMSLELRMRSAPQTEARAVDEAWLDASWTAFRQTAAAGTATATDPFASMDRARLQAIAAPLGVSSTVLRSLRMRLVDVATIPERFLRRLAEEAGTSLENLRSFLAGPPLTVVRARFRSDDRTFVERQVTFDQLLVDAGLSEADRVRILSDAE